MSGKIIFLNSQNQQPAISRSDVEAGMARFEARYRHRIKPAHRRIFLARKFRSLTHLEKQLAAYRVFGDLGYGG